MSQYSDPVSAQSPQSVERILKHGTIIGPSETEDQNIVCNFNTLTYLLISPWFSLPSELEISAYWFMKTY